MMYKFEYQSSENGMIPSMQAHKRDVAVYCLMNIFFSWGYKYSDIVHHGWGFWTRGGVFLGRIVPCVASAYESEYTKQK